jgi:ankyrin repeat protein
MFFTLKSSILVISGYLRTVQVAPGHPVMPCESLGKSLQTCLSQDKSGFPDAEVNAQGGYYGNAFLAALYKGNEAIAKLLIEKGADVNAQGGFH